jgi:glycogen(starch) synthase
MTSILHITRDFPPRSNGGISTAVGGMVRATIDAGVPCAIISFDGYRPKQSANAAGPIPTAVDEDGVRVLRISAPSQLGAARDLATEVAPTHLHVHHSMLWDLAAELRERLGSKAIVHVHVAQAEQNRLRQIDRDTMSLVAQRRALADADAVITPSRACAAAIGMTGDARLEVIGLGVTSSAVADTAAAAKRAPDAPILYAGRFADINGIAELFRCIIAIGQRLPAKRFTIAGGLPDNRKAEGRWRERWTAEAPSDIRERTTFTGWLSSDELAHHYAEAALLISPSWFETFGLVVLEAMHFGLPVAATAAGGVAELITHERTGLLSPPRDVDAMVDHAVALATDRERASALGAAAAAEIRERHMWPAIVPRLLDVYA